jgi:hypothetical protein
VHQKVLSEERMRAVQICEVGRVYRQCTLKSHIILTGVWIVETSKLQGTHTSTVFVS